MTEETTTPEPRKDTMKDEIAKFVLSTAAGFIASTLAEAGYNAFRDWQNNRINQET